MRARRARPKLASREKRTTQGESVFVICALTRITSRETALRYDGLASGATVYTYAGDNPVSFTDEHGLCIDCDTVLPDGSTVGDHVRAISNKINSSSQITFSPYGPVVGAGMDPVTVAAQVYSGTNFRKMYGSPGADYASLGDAGNFAYGAVSANIGVPLGAAEAVAGGYALVAHTRAQRVGPYGMDKSATVNVPAGYKAKCQL